MIPLRCQVGLNGLNFFTGAMQTAFGPFFTVYLTTMGWSQVDIGFVLSVGTASALVFQLPAAAIVDFIHLKRFAIANCLLMLGLSALMLVPMPTPAGVLLARVLHAFASCLLAPAIASLTLQLCGHDAFSERLGINGRYASLGSAFGAALLGAVATYLPQGAVFVVDHASDHPGAADAGDIPRPRPCRRTIIRPRIIRTYASRASIARWHIFREPALPLFAVCVVLFYLANAAMLPLALNELAKRDGPSGFVVSAAIIVPQIVVALCSPWVGRLAQSMGRKPILLPGLRCPAAARIAVRRSARRGSAGGDPVARRGQRDRVRPDDAADRRRPHAAQRLPQSRDRDPSCWPPVWAPPPAPPPPAGWPTSSVPRSPFSAWRWSAQWHCCWSGG